ncbi:TPA: AAA family ATPase, partial [Klebsiella aerogenes]|nr:AAA family ATPase [Klebsiella aerogenes]
MELRLKNITSYSKENFTTINLSKKINIIYGQNGAGKSTISNYFYNMRDTCFDECECTLIEHYRPFVYNTKFIEENFYNTNEQKGVFTLSKENAEIEKEIYEKEILRKT